VTGLRTRAIDNAQDDDEQTGQEGCEEAAADVA